MWPGHRSVWSPRINSVAIKTGTHEEHLLRRRRGMVTPPKASLRSLFPAEGELCHRSGSFRPWNGSSEVTPVSSSLIHHPSCVVPSPLCMDGCPPHCSLTVCLARRLPSLKVTAHIKATWDEAAGMRLCMCVYVCVPCSALSETLKQSKVGS